MAGDKSKALPVEHWQDCWYDYWRGTRAELIAAGICDQEWFPEKLVPELRKDGLPWRAHHGMKSGTTRMRRTYDFPGGRMTHKTDAYGNEIWQVSKEVSALERARRERARDLEREELERQRVARQTQQESEKEAERLKRLPMLLRRLPPFVPGSMSEAEKHFMRAFRGLGEQHREILMEFCERLLDNEEVFIHSFGRQQRPTPLELVVNNGDSA